MLRFVLSAVTALLVAVPFASSAGAADPPPGIGIVVGPFASRLDDAAGVVTDATCAYVVRTQLDNGTYFEEAHCTFLPGAKLPSTGSVRHDETNSEGDFWSDYTYELTGELETATTYRITVYPDGTVIAESTYGAEPRDADSAEFAGWVGAVIPNGSGVVQLSPAGVSNQLKYGFSEAQILHAYNDGTEITFEDGDIEFVGRWAAGVIVFWPEGSRLVNVQPIDSAYMAALLD